MAKPLRSIDISEISDVPDLLRIVEEVRTTDEPRVLRRGDEELVVLRRVNQPSKRRRERPVTEADREAFRSTAGSWEGIVDVDKFIEDNRASRQISTRPPVEL